MKWGGYVCVIHFTCQYNYYKHSEIPNCEDSIYLNEYDEGEVSDQVKICWSLSTESVKLAKLNLYVSVITSVFVVIRMFHYYKFFVLLSTFTFHCNEPFIIISDFVSSFKNEFFFPNNEFCFCYPPNNKFNLFSMTPGALCCYFLMTFE